MLSNYRTLLTVNLRTYFYMNRHLQPSEFSLQQEEVESIHVVERQELIESFFE